MRRFARQISLIISSLVASSHLAAQAPAAKLAAAPSLPLTKVFQIDSVQIRDGTVSPDGKWVVFAQAEPPGGHSSIWMAPLNGVPIRITGSGYRDAFPAVSPSGDRVVFVSNRPGRGADTARRFLMSIAIDRASGSPTGAPRQLVTGTARVMQTAANGFSPDGEWVAFVSRSGPPASDSSVLELAPLAGGRSRIVKESAGQIARFISFAPNGKSLSYSEILRSGPTDPFNTTITDVDVESGRTLNLKKYLATWAVRLGPEDGDYAGVPSKPYLPEGTGPIEFHDSRGRVIGLADRQQMDNAGIRARGDGRGLVFTKLEARPWIARRYQLGSGSVETLNSPRPVWTDGLLADGSRAASNAVNGQVVVTVVSPNGKQLHQWKLDPGIADIEGVLPGTSMVIARGKLPDSAAAKTKIDRNDYPVPAYIVDVTTGKTEEISRSTINNYLPNDGNAQPVAGIVERRGNTFDVQNVASNGTKHLVRSMPRALYDSLWEGDVHGTSLGVAQGFGEDSVVVSVTRGPTGPRVRLGAFPGVQVTYVAWSPSGDRLAALHFPKAAKGGPAILDVYPVGPDGTLSGAPARLDIGIHADGIGSMAWLNDGSAVVAELNDADKNDEGVLMIRPVDPTRRSIRITDSASGGIDAFTVSPEGASIVYQVKGMRRASIWTVEFPSRVGAKH